MTHKRFKTLSAQHVVRSPGLRPAAELGRRQDVTGQTVAVQSSALVELWSELHAAMVIGVSAQSLSRWRKAGVGPSFLRLGRKVRYRPGDVVAWIDSQVQHSAGPFS